MSDYGKHFIDTQDVKSLNKVLKSSFLTTGPTTLLFERKIKNYLKTKNFISCSSGTAALDLVFKVLNFGLKIFDEAILKSCWIIFFNKIIFSFNVDF